MFSPLMPRLIIALENTGIQYLLGLLFGSRMMRVMQEQQSPTLCHFPVTQLMVPTPPPLQLYLLISILIQEVCLRTELLLLFNPVWRQIYVLETFWYVFFYPKKFCLHILSLLIFLHFGLCVNKLSAFFQCSNPQQQYFP